jgi:hypothetical protein
MTVLSSKSTGRQRDSIRKHIPSLLSATSATSISAYGTTSHLAEVFAGVKMSNRFCDVEPYIITFEKTRAHNQLAFSNVQDYRILQCLCLWVVMSKRMLFSSTEQLDHSAKRSTGRTWWYSNVTGSSQDNRNVSAAFPLYALI